MNNILVSLIIPAYNVENLIPMTLESVSRQTLKAFECIIVNDYSKDGTEGVVKEFIKRDKRFKLINHRANAGLAAARNTGLRFAQGRFVAFLDSDDLIMPESLEMRAKVLEETADKRVIGSYAGSVTIDMNCKVPPVGKDVNLKVVDFITSSGNCPFNANQPMFRRELFKKFGGFDHSLKQAEDYDMWMRVLRCGYKVIPIEKQLVTYRETDGSMIRNNPLLHLDISYKLFKECYKTYPEEKWNNKFKTNLVNGLTDYLSELSISTRVLEFVGIGLSKNIEKKLLLDRLVAYLPNYFDIIGYHRDFFYYVKNGINRYYNKNIDLNSIEFEELNFKINELYVDFKKSFTEKNNKSAKIDNILFGTNNIVGMPAVQELIDLIFIPHKDYHVHTINLMKPFLDDLGVRFIIVDNSMHYRDEGVVQACKKYDLAFVGYSNFMLGNFKPKAIAVFNDWDPIARSIILSAKKSNITTIGIVEGIQDYLDADTKQNRHAYRTVDNLFLPGEHDKKYFMGSDQKISVGGVPRIFDMYTNRKPNDKISNKVALINSNFSYGVLEECRDAWLESAVSACLSAGFKPVITRHPADKGTLFPALVTDKSFYEALDECSVLISRFASGILEALAVDKCPLYFNPHKEKVDKFFDSLGAYPVLSSEEELVRSLNDLENVYGQCRINFRKFLVAHCGDFARNPSDIIAEKISQLIKVQPEWTELNNSFQRNLSRIDSVSGCFNNLKAVREIVSVEDKIFSYDNDTIEQNIDLKFCNNLLNQKKYKEAKFAFELLLDSDSSNPAYNSGYEIACKLNSLYSAES